MTTTPTTSARSRRVGVVLVVCAAALLGGVLATAPRAAHAQDWEVEDGDRERKIVERLLAILETDPLNDYAFGQLRQRAVAIGGLEAVIERYRERLAADPNDATTLLLLARLHQASGDHELALRYLDQAEGVGGAGWQLYQLRGVLRAETGDLAGAQADLETALASASARDDKIALLRELGDLARRDGRTEEAVAAYLRIVELDPKDRYLRWELAGIFYEQELWEPALEQYRAAAELAGRNVEERSRAELEIAGVYEKLDRWADAIAAYDAILDRSKETHWLHREARTRLVDAYRSANDLEGLLARLERRLEKSPRDEWALGLRARLLDDLGRAEEAIVAYERWLERAREVDPDVQQAYLRLVRQHRSRSDVQRVYEQLVERTRDAEQRLGHLLELVRFLRTTSDVPLEAYTRLRDYERDQLGSTSDTGALERYERVAEAYLEFGQSTDAVERARALYEQILERDPGRLPVHMALLMLAVDRGEVESEAELLERIVAMEGFDATVAEDLVELYRTRGATTQASRVLDIALARYPDDLALKFLRANQLDLATQPGEALEAWRELLLSSDDDHHLRTAARNYLDLLVEHGVLEPTIEWFERAWAEAPEQWRTGRLLFYLYAWDGRLDDALQLLSSLQIQLASTVSLEDQAFALLQTHHPEKALTLLRTLSEKRPHVAWRYTLQGAELLILRGRTDAALPLIEQALAGAPDNPDALGAAGDLYARLGAHADAERVLSEAVRLAPRNPLHRLALAGVLVALQRSPADAERAYGLVLDALPLAADLQLADDLLIATVDAGRAAGLADGRIGDDLRNAADLIARRELAQHIRDFAQSLAGTF